MKLTLRYRILFLLALSSIVFCMVFTVLVSAVQLQDQIAYQPNVQIIDNNTLRIHKSIKQLATDTFELTLTVDASNGAIAETLHPGASVVLVLDNSGSMLQPFSDGKNRAEALREAANDFLDLFLGSNASPYNEIAVVAYETTIDTFVSFGFNSGARNTDLAAAKAAVDYAIYPFAQGTTNQQIAMKTARDYLKSANNTDKYMIVFSDGAPNHSYNGVSGEFTNRIIPAYGYSFDFYVTDFGSYQPFSGYTVAGQTVTSAMQNELLATISEGLIAQDQGIQVFTVFAYGLGTDVAERNRAEFVMKNVATDESLFFEVDNIADLIIAFEQIAEDLKQVLDIWQVEDPMGYGMNYTKLISLNGVSGDQFDGVVFDANANKLHWDLLNPLVPPETIDDGNYTTRFTLQYQIVFDSAFVKQDDAGYFPGKQYPTNQPTSINHYLQEYGNPANQQTLLTAWFDLPEVIAAPLETLPPSGTESSSQVTSAVSSAVNSNIVSPIQSRPQSKPNTNTGKRIPFDY